MRDNLSYSLQRASSLKYMDQSTVAKLIRKKEKEKKEEKKPQVEHSQVQH